MSKYSFSHIFILLILMIGLQNDVNGQGVFSMEEHIDKWKNSMEYTLEVAHLMPDSLYNYKPTEEEMTFGEQLQHMAQNMTWLATAYLMDDQKYIKDEVFKKPLSPADIRSLISTSYEFSMQALQKIEIKNLDKSKDFFAGPKTIRQFIHLLHDHATHHRGQLMVYLRLNGIKPPKYRGW